MTAEEAAAFGASVAGITARHWPRAAAAGATCTPAPQGRANANNAVARASTAVVSKAAEGPSSNSASKAQATGTRLKAALTAGVASRMCTPDRRPSSTCRNEARPAP